MTDSPLSPLAATAQPPDTADATRGSDAQGLASSGVTAALPAVVTELLDVQTGEVLPATVGNAARVIQAARDMKTRIQEVIEAATAYLVAESQHAGTKTLHAGAQTVTLTGGSLVEYDATDLMGLLRDAGCPEARIDEAVVATVEYKVDRSVLRQLAAANPDYAAAIDLAGRVVQKPMRASVK